MAIDGCFFSISVAAITPAFHTLYLEAMVKVFSDCSEKMILKSEKLLREKEVSSGEDTIELDLEAEFSSLALDIIGLSVFNYDFGSVTKESPVIKVIILLLNWLSTSPSRYTGSLIYSVTSQAVYGTLFEAEHRSTFYFPYWKFPPARWIVPRQRKFQSDLKIINDCLDGLIQNAKETRQVFHFFFVLVLLFCSHFVICSPRKQMWRSFSKGTTLISRFISHKC